MKDPVLTKADMYARLSRGDFGNTNAQWTGNYAMWMMERASPQWAHQKLWGVRHTRVSGFPGTQLNVPSDQVQHVIREGGFGPDYNISPMVPTGIRWEGDICRSHDGPGLVMSGNFRPANGSWRTHMKTPRLIQGTAAYWALKAVLNENSYDDLMILLDEYPDHVVELSALDVCFGTVPGRNAVVWECRFY